MRQSFDRRSSPANTHNSKRHLGMMDIQELLEAMAAPAFLALFGGIARVCRYGATSWRHFVGSVVVSAFTGVVVHLLIMETSLSESVQAAIVATSGYSGGAILDALVNRIVSGVKSLPVGGKRTAD